jgi:hypothetical protein
VRHRPSGNSGADLHLVDLFGAIERGCSTDCDSHRRDDCSRINDGCANRESRRFLNGFDAAVSPGRPADASKAESPFGAGRLAHRGGFYAVNWMRTWQRDEFTFPDRARNTIWDLHDYRDGDLGGSNPQRSPASDRPVERNEQGRTCVQKVDGISDLVGPTEPRTDAILTSRETLRRLVIPVAIKRNIPFQITD